MKGIFLTITLLAFCCNAFAKKEVSLNDAISAVSTELMKSPKIGKWKKIVLMNSSDSIEIQNIEIQNYIEEELANKLVHGFTVIDRKNLGILREELEFQNTGKADPNSIKKIGSIYGADFVLWGIFKDGELKIQAENIQNGTTSLIHKESIKDDDVLRNLKKNTTSVNLCFSCGITLDSAIEKAISDLTKKILESKKNNVLVYNILADKSELSKDIHGRIGTILSKDKNINLLTNRDELDHLETEMSFQASGEVDAGTIKKKREIVCGTFRYLWKHKANWQ